MVHGIDRMIGNVEWVPVVLGPIGAAVGVAGFFSERMAKTVLPIASAAIVANGIQGTYPHARGIAQKPGGWRNACYRTTATGSASGDHGRGMGLLLDQHDGSRIPVVAMVDARLADRLLAAGSPA